LAASGAGAVVVGFVLVIRFVHVGFLVKKVLKEQQGTNEILSAFDSA
jgi:hypothetical protein